MGEIKGYISQVIGPVVDIHFDYGTEETVTLPRIHDAWRFPARTEDLDRRSSATHRGKHRPYRSDGYDRRIETRHGGRVIRNAHHHADRRPSQRTSLMNVTGDPIDGMAQLTKDGALPIHREPPKFEDLTTTQEVLYTGIKVIDLLEPYAKGGKIGLSEEPESAKRY